MWQDANLLQLWVCCLLKANHSEAWVPVDGIKAPVHLQPGQFITGRFMLHAALYPRKRKRNPCAKTVWRWLQILEKAGNLSLETSKRYTIVTIAAWETYQGNGVADVQEDVPDVSR